MRIGIISDIHGNLEALKAVLLELDDVERLICLGDIVGYGPDPEPCVEMIREKADVVVAGNHDWGAIGKTSIDGFNPVAYTAILWTSDHLSEDSRNYLASLPLEHTEGEYTFAHACFSVPEKWFYIIGPDDAEKEFLYLRTMAGFVGHSHVPGIFIKSGGRVKTLFRSLVEMDDGSQFIINCGSVGQPRDGNPDATACILDTDSNEVRIIRVPYDAEKTKGKIVASGLPEILGERLLIGR